ncbi:Transposable element Tcb1 transposase, partial [Camponotus floridanus]
TVKHGIKVHLWGCFSKQGFGTLHLFTYNLNAERMLQIYKKALLPFAKRWFIRKNDDWILQEDNDPKHRSKLCTEWKTQSGIVTLDWPSQS